AEVVRQAARRGLRVLVQAPHAAGVDRLLELAAADPEVLTLRVLGRDESTAERTLASAARRLADDALAQAPRPAEGADGPARRRPRDEAVHDRLSELAGRDAQLAAEEADLDRRAAAVDAEVGRLADAADSSDPFHKALRYDDSRRAEEARRAAGETEALNTQ